MYVVPFSWQAALLFKSRKAYLPSILLLLVSCGIIRGSTLSFGAVDLRGRFLVSYLIFYDDGHRVVWTRDLAVSALGLERAGYG